MAETDAITAAIQSSMNDAGLTETADADTGDGDTGDSGDTGDTATAVEGSPSAAADDAGDGTADSTVAATVEEPVVEDPAAAAKAKELEELGLPVPKPGQKRNPIPQDRVKVMVEKGIAKGEARAAATLAAKDTEIGQLKSKADEYTRLNTFADQDPTRFLEAMAVANPKVWKPVLAQLQGKAPAAETKVAAVAGTPMPKPNAKLADGSMTYDEKGLTDLLEWNRTEAAAAAEARITKQFEDRFGPIEQDHKAAAWRAAEAPKIAAQIAEARKEWGPLFEEDYQKAERGEKSDILTYINEQKAKGVNCSLERACQAVLLPKLRTDRTKMRGEIIAELNKRPAAATETRTSVKASEGPRSMEQIIKDSMTEAGLR